MNTSTPSTPDLEGLSKAVQQFQPNPRRIQFNDLKSVHDSIVELRKHKASYSAIAELLRQHGVKTSRARVAEYGRIVLDGGKSRKRRKRILPAINASPIPQSPLIASTVAPATGNNFCPSQRKTLPMCHADYASPR